MEEAEVYAKDQAVADLITGDLKEILKTIAAQKQRDNQTGDLNSQEGVVVTQDFRSRSVTDTETRVLEYDTDSKNLGSFSEKCAYKASEYVKKDFADVSVLKSEPFFYERTRLDENENPETYTRLSEIRDGFFLHETNRSDAK